MTQQLAFFDKDLIPWRDYPLFDYYRRLFDLKRRNAALWNGYDENEAVRIKTTQNSPIYMFERSMNGDYVLGMFNLSSETVDFQPTDTFSEGTYRNIFTDELVGLSSDLEFSLGGWQFLAFEQVSGNSIEDLDEGVNRPSPSFFKLKPAYPNPFNPSTRMQVELSTSAELRVEVWDYMGRLRLEQNLGLKGPGVHPVTIEAHDWVSGSYLVRVYAGEQVRQRRITLIK
jgi:hypothetical protein